MIGYSTENICRDSAAHPFYKIVILTFFPTEYQEERLTKAESPDFARRVPDEVYAEASREFSEVELLNLTIAVTAINAWNRINIAFRNIPGEYQVAKAA